MDINFADIMKQAKELQAKLKTVQEGLAEKTVNAEAGGGMVSVTVNGRHEIVSIRLDPVCVDARDIPMLQDLITAAVNLAVRKSRELVADEMKQVTGGLPLPFDMI